jgi:D-amino-acid dehydrogenase
MTTIVLGAGVVGTASAWYLNAIGEDVTVIERRDAAGMETSWGNGGVIHASEVEPWSQPGMPRNILRWLGREDAPLLLRYGAIPRVWRWGLRFARNSTPARFRRNCEANLALALLSLQSLQEIRAEAGIAYDAASSGVLKIYRSNEALERATASLGHLAPLGLQFSPLDGRGCARVEPALAPIGDTLAGGLHFPRDEVGDCNAFTQGLAAAAADRGVRFRFATTLEAIETAQGRVTAVHTSAGRLPADRVVAALGSYTGRALRALGLDVPIQPVKGVSITFPRGDWARAPAMPVIDDSYLFGLVPIGKRIRISGSAEITGFDVTPADSRCQAILANATRTFQDLGQVFDRSKAIFWAGLRPVTPTGTPLIGETRIKGLWINAGHGHLGWTLACGSGRVLARLVSARPPGVALVPFSC